MVSTVVIGLGMDAGALRQVCGVARPMPRGAAWGRGVGSALIAQARADLAAAGVEEAQVWVLVGNARAERFCQRDGWVTDGMRRSDTVWGVVVDEAAYRRRL